ncbi:hypothetical protein D9756_000415 [Leucocoprinus leucothites]|uniref:Uncharacterized protein n=1 Tax=Leucocoprinus leucothites TaxID=201217 RepID=A0A8H5LNK7_9AGAR|nr:hypothetical protein D9756_000415 [Leucoagaricus leucothites]
MSRLTASPFHKPSPFVFPKEPISPPETLLTDTGYPTVTAIPPVSGEQREGRNEEPIPFIHADTTLQSRLGRPSISYQNSGFRDTPNRSVHRNYRFFVVVIPPPRLINEHGQLGHTLASGPSHRLSQGIIMPLFPTMYGQLTAIAREFNFPSTAGLCLYLHVNESGVVMTPRISDESWHMLWSHLFESPSLPRGPPIGGRIEFDIDSQHARWYSSWLSTMVRDRVERPFSHIPSGAPSVVMPTEHRDSIDIDGDLRDSEQLENLQVQPRHGGHSRHVPRKLSLVDRFDILTSHTESKAGSAQALVPPDQGVPNSKALSPIVQEEEPHSAREQLDNRVKSWRASAVTKPSSLAARGQTSLEPFNLPNNVSCGEDTPSSASIELNLDDFTWSVSSVGPGDSDFMSLGSPSERLPSPDMARRMLDDSPPTPSTATSWGAPLSYPPSPLSDFRPPSLDLAFRSIFSPPMTPATATSWGPLSPTSSSGWHYDIPRAHSIHLGERGEFSRPVTPSTATSWGAPLSYPPTPTTPFHVQTPDVAKRSFDLSQELGFATVRLASGEQPWHFVWPYYNTRRAVAASLSSEMQPWHCVWPYYNAQNVAASSTEIVVKHASRYPFLSIYPPVYPYFDLYPAKTTSTDQKTKSTISIKVTLGTRYPSLQIYTPVYPHNLVIYPEIQQPKESLASIFVASSQYPSFDIYPAVYPYFDLYPAISFPLPAPSAEATGLSHGSYPNLIIYPAVYPNFDIYPMKAAEVVVKKAGSVLKQIQVTLSAQYPKFNIYPAVYPNFDIYPVFSTDKKLAANLSSLTVSKSQYPIFDLYPAVYPHFRIYPSKAGNGTTSATRNIQTAIIISQSDAYPIIRPYPPVYPSFDLYPSMTTAVTVSEVREITVLLPFASSYPTFEIYPPVYPCFSLYPSIAGQVKAVQGTEIWGTAISHYPYFQIYKPVYPHLNIYPPIPTSMMLLPEARTDVSTARQLHDRPSRKSHHDLHQEVFQYHPVRTPSGTGMTIRPEADLLPLLPLSVPNRHSPRRIAATRSPTGPAFHRPVTPPALPSPSRQLPTPPLLANGIPRSPSVMEQMAGFRAEVATARRYPPPAQSPSRTRASMISPLRQMPVPRSAESSAYSNETLASVPSSGLHRARSAGNAGRTPTIKPRIRDSFIVQRRHDL